MIPISGGSTTTPFVENLNTNTGRTDRCDPIRLAVQVSLTLYLMPVILLVCMIGGVSILASKAGSLAGQAFGANREEDRERPRLGRTGRYAVRPRLSAERSRSEATH